MKKLTSLILALSLACSLSISASAENATSTISTGVSTGTVDVAIYSSGYEEIIYSLVITWGNTEMTYMGGNSSTWDPDTHNLTTVGDEGGWVDNTADVTITNHSNDDVTAKLACTTNLSQLTYEITPNDGTDTTEGIFSLATAVGTLYSSAPNGMFTITATDEKPAAATGSYSDVFTVTVTGGSSAGIVTASGLEDDPYAMTTSSETGESVTGDEDTSDAETGDEDASDEETGNEEADNKDMSDEEVNNEE